MKLFDTPYVHAGMYVAAKAIFGAVQPFCAHPVGRAVLRASAVCSRIVLDDVDRELQSWEKDNPEASGGQG